MINAVTPALREQFAILDRAVAKTGYLVGDQFTFADINLLSFGSCPKAPRPSPPRPILPAIMSGIRHGRASTVPYRALAHRALQGPVRGDSSRQSAPMCLVCRTRPSSRC